MEQVCQPANLNRAYARVKANKGAPGVGGNPLAGATIGQLAGWIRQHKQELIASLLDGSYQPQPVRGVQIPKIGGGMRQLGIPTVVDRLVQQAILQGVPRRRAWLLAQSGKGWWRLSGSPPAMEGMSLAWFNSIGLMSLTKRHAQLQG